jgi:hypothetical protein
VVRTCEAIVLDYRQVKNSGGRIEERYVIHTRLGLGDQNWPIDLTLTNRSGMRFRMLLGRTAVRGRLVVDPGKAYLCGRLRTKAYGVARPSARRKKVS